MKHRKLLTAASITAMLVSAPAFAADDATSQRAVNPDPDTVLTTNENGSGNVGQTGDATSARSETPDQSDLSEHELAARDMIGKSVYDADGEKLGEIVNVTPGGTGGQPQAVLAVSKFLGFGERKVAIPAGEITMTGGRLQTQMKASEVEDMPEFKTEAGGDVRE